MTKPITVLKAVSQASLELGLTQRAVTAAISSDDQDIVQMTALLQAVADEVLSEEPYKSALGDGYWIASSDGQTLKTEPTADSDLILFDGRLAINGLKFRFNKAKGLEFGEEMRDFTARLNRLAAEANARVLDLDADPGVIQ